MPLYPVYPSQPNSGDLPTQVNMGPFDLYPTSSTAPAYQENFDMMYGRHLAGAEKPVGSDDEPAYALNELRLMAEMDDVDGNGVFEQPGSRPNIYPDAGIFASDYSVPGYLHRERMYAPSEIIDANTGRPVTYVNGGTVSMDSTAMVAFMEGGMYAPPRPYLDMYSEHDMSKRSTVNVAQNPVAVTNPGPPTMAPRSLLPAPVITGAEAGAQAGLGDAGSVKTLLIGLAIAGLGAGAVYAMTRPPAHTPNRRRRRKK